MFKQNVVKEKQNIEIPYLIENGAKTTFYHVYHHAASLLLQTACHALGDQSKRPMAVECFPVMGRMSYVCSSFNGGLVMQQCRSRIVPAVSAVCATCGSEDHSQQMCVHCVYY